MAKQIIDIGTSANKGDGDPLRTAFRKINENFNELYTANGNVSGAVADVLPSTDSTYDLGSAAKQWADLHVADFIYLNGARIEITAGGALLVNGGAPTEVQDVQGSVFGDDSTTLVDGVNNVINLDGTISGDVVPDANEAYDLGSATNRFRDIYLSGSTIDLGGTTLSVVGGVLQIGGTDINDVVTAAGINSLTAGSNIPTLETAYDDARAVLDALLDAGDYGAQLAPPSDYTYYGIAVQQKALNPLIPDEVVDEALNVLNAYNAWQNEIEAETATITVGDREWKFKGDGTVDGLNVDGDITGSVFGDDSTLLVDGVNSKINLQNTVLNNTISTINDEALYLNTATIPGDRGGRITTTDNIFDIYGATLPDGNGGGVWIACGIADPGK